MNVQPFSLTSANTQTISATNVSSGITFPQSGAQSSVVRIFNSGLVTIFVRATVGASTALTSDIPIAAGSVELFTKGNNDTISAITANGSATVYVTPGEGQ